MERGTPHPGGCRSGFRHLPPWGCWGCRQLFCPARQGIALLGFEVVDIISAGNAAQGMAERQLADHLGDAKAREMGSHRAAKVVDDEVLDFPPKYLLGAGVQAVHDLARRSSHTGRAPFAVENT